VKPASQVSGAAGTAIASSLARRLSARREATRSTGCVLVRTK
jgi:hypothetical protein